MWNAVAPIQKGCSFPIDSRVDPWRVKRHSWMKKEKYTSSCSGELTNDGELKVKRWMSPKKAESSTKRSDVRYTF